MPKWVKAARVGDVPDKKGIRVDVEDEPIALFYVNDTYYALSHTCPHQGGPLSEGEVEAGKVTCPWHGWQFFLDAKKAPSNDGVYRFPVRVQGEDIEVEMPD